MQKKKLFKIHGMECAEEAALLKKEVGPLAGGEDRLSFNIFEGKMTDSITDEIVTRNRVW